MRCAWLVVLALTACGDDSSAVPDAACAQRDCAGVCNGSAVADRCDVCDTDPTNDCWTGKHGTAQLNAFPQPTDLGSGNLGFSEADAATHRGYFYAGPPGPLGYGVAIANVKPMNACDPTGFPDNPGYVGLSSVHELTDAASLPYTQEATTVLLGAEASDCYSGLLVYRQNSRYGVLRFISLEASPDPDPGPTARANVEYWIGDIGVTDFRNAP